MTTRAFIGFKWFAVMVVAATSVPLTAGADHLLFSADHNLPLAHRLVDGHVVASAGEPGFAKYLVLDAHRRSWKWRPEAGRATMHRRGLLTLPRELSTEASELVLFVEGSGTLEAWSRGRRLAKESVPASGTVRIPLLPRHSIVELRTRRAGTVAIRGFSLGSPGHRGNLETNENRTVRARESLIFHLMVPASGTYLSLAPASSSCPSVAAVLDARGRKPQAVRGKHDVRAHRGRVIRLLVSAPACPTGTRLKGGLYGGSSGPPGTPPTRPKNVVLWVMDSLRADHVRSINPKAPAATPNLDWLSQNGTVFRAAYSSGHESRVSHASIWSSRYPQSHGLFRKGKKLASTVATLPKLMKRAGLTTIGVTSNGWITDRNGFGGAWDSYKNHIHDGGGMDGRGIVSGALRRLNARRGGPWFLYIGTVDTHVPWTARSPWIQQLHPDAYRGPYKNRISGIAVEKMVSGKKQLTKHDQRYIRAVYASNAAYQDQLLGQVLDSLRKRGELDDTLVIVTADHGDELWENGRVGHGRSIAEEATHIPLIVYGAGLRTGHPADGGAESVDILPTILEALGQPIPDELQGHSLGAVSRAPYPTSAVTSDYERSHAIRFGPWKLQLTQVGTTELWNVASDPGEDRELSAARPRVARYLQDSLSLFIAFEDRWTKRRWGSPTRLSKRAFH